MDDDDCLQHYAKIFSQFGSTVLLGDQKEAFDKYVREGGEPRDILTSRDEAFVILILVNNQESWTKAAQSGSSGRGRSNSSTKWTSGVRGRHDAKYETGEKRYVSGWSKEGMDFLEKAIQFFSELRENDDHFSKLKVETSKYKVLQDGKKAAAASRNNNDDLESLSSNTTKTTIEYVPVSFAELL